MTVARDSLGRLLAALACGSGCAATRPERLGAAPSPPRAVGLTREPVPTGPRHPVPSQATRLRMFDELQIVSVSRTTDANGRVLSGEPARVDRAVDRLWTDTDEAWEARVIGEALAAAPPPSRPRGARASGRRPPTHTAPR